MTFHPIVPFAPAIAVMLVAGCTRAQLGLPATPVSASSPDGSLTAYVRNHPSIDPPSQSLWLRLADGREVELAQLAEDQDWSNVIVWSADGTRVGFLVQDSRLALADANAGRIVGWTILVEDHRDYPTAELVKDLSLSADGREASYRVCRRPSTVRRVSQAEADASCGPIIVRALRAY
jgi:hypothetical protein